MNVSRDGEKPWSEDDLFDLDSALDWGGTIEDIADFLGREVAEVRRKACERDLPKLSNPGPIAPTVPVVQIRALCTRIDLVEPDHALRSHERAVHVPFVKLIILTQPRGNNFL